MKSRTRQILLISAALIILLAAFLAGALAYRAGLLTDLRQLVLPANPQPTATKPVINPDFSFQVLTDPQSAVLNDQALATDQEPLRFLVAGHIYGKPGENEFHPAPTLLTHIALLNQLQPDFVVLLGDMVWRPTPENFDQLELLVLNQLTSPVFNAVGNHDVSRRTEYQQRYGNTVYGFRHKDQLFLVLDTTLDYYDLTPDQYQFILDAIIENLPDLNTIHIFMHHLLFLSDEEVVSRASLKPNEGDGQSAGFQDFLEEELEPLSDQIPIYVYAGDVGAIGDGNLSPLYKESDRGQITFLAVGLGGNPSDTVLIVETDPDGAIQIRPFSLGGKDLGAIEEYSLKDWFAK